VGSGKRWFVGDLGAWQEDPHKDKARLGSTFGCVWVGYVGEEAEAKQALRWGMLQWAWAFMWALILLLVLRVVQVPRLDRRAPPSCVCLFPLIYLCVHGLA
jgi:hypothetical protein